uniref:HECT domain-containing protein n=1 Tax=Biomphalaria glabrata TaxID=6526 RepID=A0A2C9KB19_BIOGL
MATSSPESSQWLSVTEETLFLHDGLLRVTDLVELPKNVENCGSRDNEVVAFDSKDPEELSAKLLEICGTRNNAFNTLLEYRLNALKGLWKAQKLSQEEQVDREASSQDEAIALLKKQGLLKDTEQASFSTRISLLLILPLLQSQSKTDPELCGVTSGVILTCLRYCPPLSLAKEPSDCLNGLESLLCEWLEEQSKTGTVDKKHQENAASALVALACARGHVKTFIHTVHLLQQLSDIPPLPVAEILSSLLDSEGGQGQISCFLGSKYILSWGLDDLLGPNNADTVTSESKETNEKDKEKDQDLGRSITTDGFFIYTTNNFGKGIAKIGTGLQGTLRGYVYNKNPEHGPGRLAYGSELLMFRPQKFDTDSENEFFLQLIDKETLEVLMVLYKPSMFVQPGPCTTVGFCSDGVYFYWLWCPALVQDKTSKGVSVNICAFNVERDLEVRPLRPVITLQKKEEAVSRNVNEAILNRLRPLRGSNSAATLMALTGGEALMPSRKEDTPSAGSTSCGVQLKTLVKTPLYCDGNHVVMLTLPPGVAPGGAGRSLFGGGGPISSMRTLASNLCFNVRTGFFSARMDLMEATSSSVGRGTALTNIGACFDIVNNMLWMSSGEYVDQFYNPGNLPPHHIYSRLGISNTSLSLGIDDNGLMPVNAVINTLLHNVGSMCLHQMTGDASFRHCQGLGAQASQTESMIDICHLTRVTEILDRAVADHDDQAVICCLVVLQLIFKTSAAPQKKLVTEEMKSTRTLIWKLLTIPWQHSGDLNLSKSIKLEACHVITVGLRALYPTSEDRHVLMYQLLTSGEDNPSLVQLRNMILTEFANQLSSQQPAAKDKDVLQLDDLVLYILKLAVKESCTLLTAARKCSRLEFNRMISNMPLSSPAVQYLAALRSYYLRCAVLHDSTQDNLNSDNLTLEELQGRILSLSSKLINGACEVLESYLETCSSVLGMCTGTSEDVEGWLAGLERLAKSTILGSLMPVLITTLTHQNLQCLNVADALMPSLVTLSLLASQAALIMKSQELAVNTSMTSTTDVDLGTDKEMAEFIGEALNTDHYELNVEEEEGFLTGLKIPTPWASGKTVETIHPVRDNYKFKETVHIPGARCLYLRFDARCSSQYDYDKVVVYAGPGINGKKVVEYGGNSFGYGSRSVLGSGWPKDLVKVTFSTFFFNLSYQKESAEEVTPGLPFLSDLALGLSVLVCTQLALLYHGSPPSQDEIDCQHLLRSKILQRCIWKTERCLEAGDRVVDLGTGGLPSPPPAAKKLQSDDADLSGALVSAKLPRIKLSTDIMERLRHLVKRQPLRLRASIKSAISLDILEESTISAVAKHLGLTDSLRDLRSVVEKQGDELAALLVILEETYRRFDVLIRQLQLMGELEKRWETEVEDRSLEVTQRPGGSEEMSSASSSHEPPFFYDYHLHEIRYKELTILSFIKEVPFEPADLETTVKQLMEKFDAEVEALKSSGRGKSGEGLTKTKQVMAGILSRLELLLHVNSVPMETQPALSHTVSHTQGFKEDLMVRSDTDVLRPYPGFSRSMSAPVCIDPYDSSTFKQGRWKHGDKGGYVGSILQDLVDDGDEDKPPHVIVIDQLFAFIGNDPEKAVSCVQFLKAAEERRKRGASRKTALNHIKELLAAASNVGGATHLVAAVASVLRHGPKVDDLMCGGMLHEVREAFAEAMSSVVQLAAQHPIASASSIGLLCTIPYTRAEEKCLVRSHLVHLLDKLCSLGNHRADGLGAEAQTPRQKVSALAWAGFQVLASRCVKWENEDGSQVDELEHSGLAKQVSTLLTHHLARATEGIGNAMAGTEALQEVLSLLNNLSRGNHWLSKQDYLQMQVKKMTSKEKSTATQVLTEIFYSSFFVDQHQDTGEISLNREQVLNAAPENLLALFLNGVRVSKKPLPEAVTCLLRQYGIVKSQDKHVSPQCLEKGSKGKTTKKPVSKSQKEKQALGLLEKSQEEKYQTKYQKLQVSSSNFIKHIQMFLKEKINMYPPQTAPEMFHFVQYTVNESKISTDVHFPGAACVLVSCSKTPDSGNKETPPYRAPWARISTYTGKRIRKCGQVTRQEVVCYPRDVHAQANTNDQYAPVFIPGDLVYVKIGVSPPPGAVITLHGLPPQFLLAVAYMETLVTETFGCGAQACGARGEKTGGQKESATKPQPSLSSGSFASSSSMALELPDTNPSLWSLDNINITPPVFLHMIEFLCGFLWKTDVPALLKEFMFHLLAQTLRILHFSEGCDGSRLTKLSMKLSPTQGMLNYLPRELKKLYDLEIKNLPEMTTTAGQGVGLGVSDTGRWSTYLHALMEVCLAISEVIPCEVSQGKQSTEVTVEESAAGSSSVASSSTSKKKKLKFKKERIVTSIHRANVEPRSGSETTENVDGSLSSSNVHLSQSLDAQPTSPSGQLSVVSPPIKASSNSSICSMFPTLSTSSIKVDDMAWFPVAASTAKILRYLALKEPHCQEEVNEAFKSTSQVLVTPTAHSRLLVITGIPSYLDLSTVKKSICKVCNSYGGLDRDEIFVPTPLDVSASEPKPVNPEASNPDAVVSGEAGQEAKSESLVSQSNTPTTPTPEPRKKSKFIEGYAVISLPSRTKVEIVKKAFLKTKWLNLGLGEEAAATLEAPDENLNVQTVSPALLTEPEANPALEKYLLYKLSGRIGAQTRRELLGSEAALTRMYIRTAFLQLTDHCNSPAMELTSFSASLGSGMAACAATLQELDLENIQLLSEHLLAPPFTTGTLEATSPFQVSLLSQLSLTPLVSLTSLVYRNSLRLKRELAVAIARASNQGEDYLIELTNQLCMCLQKVIPLDLQELTVSTSNTVPVKPNVLSMLLTANLGNCVVAWALRPLGVRMITVVPFLTRSMSKEMIWDVARPFPPTRACLFSHGMTAIMFLGDPSAGVGLPRGTMVYANQPIPKEAPSFYWELEISSFGDSHDESSAVISFGFAPPAEKKDAAWTNPVGTCLFLNTGKAVHYNGASLLQWRSVRLEVSLIAGDVAGIGWERTGDTQDTTQTPRGQVYFTYNGQRLNATLDNVSGAMYPVVHIQKKNCRMKANFGARPFAYAEGQQHREAAEAANDVLRDIRESFGHLPFHTASDSESDSTEPPVTSSQESSRDSRTPPRAPCKVAEPPPTQKEYQIDASLNYKLLPCYDNFVITGPDTMFVRPNEEDSEEETVIEESSSEDHYALLVKAWEQKVFPVIRRRFRNEAERKDGLEQIRGALQLGDTSKVSIHCIVDEEVCDAVQWHQKKYDRENSLGEVVVLHHCFLRANVVAAMAFRWRFDSTAILRYAAHVINSTVYEFSIYHKDKLIAVQLPTGNRLPVVEAHCQRLRMLYRDCAKPPPPPCRADIRPVFNKYQREISDAVLAAVQAVILPADEATSPLTHSLHSAGDGNTMANQICRVVAEIRTRTSMVLAQYLQDVEFAKKFIEHCGYSIDMLKSLAKDCQADFINPLWETYCGYKDSSCVSTAIIVVAIIGQLDSDHIILFRHTDHCSIGGSNTFTSNLWKTEIFWYSKTDPVRAFISGHVANAMAAEVIALLHNLLSSQTSSTTNTWSQAVQRILCFGGSICCENRPFRLVSNTNVDKVVRLDRELAKNGKVELTTEEAVSAFKKAYKWAQMGLVISTAPPTDTSISENNNGVDKKKTVSEVICKDKNSELARSKMGKAILSQPACVSKLLSLLLDQRPSPKLVLIILQLCRVSLPLMNCVDCEEVELPAWGQQLYSSHWSTAKPVSDPPAKIICLLLAKLGDFLVPELKRRTHFLSKQKSLTKCEGRLLTLSSFLQFCEDQIKLDLRAIWKGLFACGYDLHLERCACPDVTAAYHLMSEWTIEKDAQISQSHSSPGLPVESIRLRFAFLQDLNNSLETSFLPLIDLRPANVYSRSTAFVLSQLRSLVFYNTKVNFINRILNASAKRKPDQAAPEITLNPLESIGTGGRCVFYIQVGFNPSSLLITPLQSNLLTRGSDMLLMLDKSKVISSSFTPGGSFRHYLWQVARELTSPSLSLLLPCPSSSAGINKGRLLLKPGKMTYSEENLLLFIGQLLGITMRADIPLGLDLLSTVWKLLVGLNLDPSTDLQQADALTYKYIKKIEMAETEAELESVCGDGEPRFVYTSLTSLDTELIPGGRSIYVNWNNRQAYIDAIKTLRMRELTSSLRIAAIVTGLSSLLPYQVLTLMSPLDLEIRTSGRPHISLDFLKSHTMYQVGLVESDSHIEFFWSALESFSQEEITRFIKFACNQERVPHTCPCQEGGSDSAHVPPFPMKIAPPDGTGPPDSRYIRVETCMFMVKLPQYSSQEVMTHRLRYAINCREDPLSG